MRIDKVLIVGNGPSHKDIDFIRNFDGTIIGVDSVTQELLDNGIQPTYVTWFEVTPPEVQVLISKLLPNLEGTTLVHRHEECKRLYDEASRYRVKRFPFQMPSYVNNVGLFSLVFAQKVLHCKEIHMIGMDHQGEDYQQSWFDSMIGEFNKYMSTEAEPDSKIIDHSNGALTEILKNKFS